MATQSEPHLTTQIFGQNPTNILACCANSWSRKFLRKAKSKKKQICQKSVRPSNLPSLDGPVCTYFVHNSIISNCHKLCMTECIV